MFDYHECFFQIHVPFLGPERKTGFLQKALKLLKNPVVLISGEYMKKLATLKSLNDYIAINFFCWKLSTSTSTRSKNNDYVSF